MLNRHRHPPLALRVHERINCEQLRNRVCGARTSVRARERFGGVCKSRCAGWARVSPCLKRERNFGDSLSCVSRY